MISHDPFLILLGGDLTRTDRLHRQIAEARVIAADGGIRHAADLDVIPELWVGDFDSSDEALHAAWARVPRQTHPRDKDMTDGELAAREALARGADGLIFAGALGGRRSDHAVQNLLHGVALAAQGIPVLLTSGDEEAWPLSAGISRRLDLAPGTQFSILAFSPLIGLTLAGVDWPLERHDVALGSSLTLSNRVGDTAINGIEVTIESGMAILLAQSGGAKGTVRGHGDPGHHRGRETR